MFFVPSVSAGPTYVNIEIPEECGGWKYNASRSHHCAGTGRGSRVKAGRDGSFKCGGGGNGYGNIMVEMDNCPTIILSTWNDNRQWNSVMTFHRTTHVEGRVNCYRNCAESGMFGLSNDDRNTKYWRADKPR
jgi:hypothetical protein